MNTQKLLNEIYFEIAQTLEEHSLTQALMDVCSSNLYGEVYLVGGVIRDICCEIQKYPIENKKDLDFAVEINAREFARQLSFQLNADVIFVLDEESQTSRILLSSEDKDSLQIDVTSLRQGNILVDLELRDFSINSMAYKIWPLCETQPLFTHPNSLSDIIKKKIRACSSVSMENDPIRILRALRIGEKMEFSFSEETIKLIQLAGKKLWDCPAERICEESMKLLQCKTYRWLNWMEIFEIPYLKTGLSDFSYFRKVHRLFLEMDSFIQKMEIFKDTIDFQQFIDEPFLKNYTRREMWMFSLLIYCSMEPERNGDYTSSALNRKIQKFFLEKSQVKRVIHSLMFQGKFQILLDDFTIDKPLYEFYEISSEEVLSAFVLLWIIQKDYREKIEWIFLEVWKFTKINPEVIFNGNEIMSLFEMESSSMIGELIKIQKLLLSTNQEYSPAEIQEKMKEYLKK